MSTIPDRPWTFIEGRTLIHIESSIDAVRAGVPVCSLPKSKRDLAELIVSLGNITPQEWQAIWDAMVFTAREAGCVSDAHNTAADKVALVFRCLPIRPQPTPSTREEGRTAASSQ